MSSRRFKTNTNLESELLNPLLPHVAGVFENVNEATFVDIKQQIESDVGHRVSDTKILSALENGIKLGVLMTKREFKVCREFTTKELKKLKLIEDNLIALKNLDMVQSKVGKQRGKALLEFVKNQRAQRRKKSTRKLKCKTTLAMSGNNDKLYKFLCQRCKKSLEKTVHGRSMSSRLISAEEIRRRDDGSSMYFGSSCTSSITEVSGRGGQSHKGSMESPKEKNSLKVEKNPMETEQPYYDIFT